MFIPTTGISWAKYLVCTDSLSYNINVEKNCKSNARGVINNELSWKDHVSFVCRKFACGIGIIIKAINILCSVELYSFYRVRIFLGDHPRSHSEPLFTALKFCEYLNIAVQFMGYTMGKYLCLIVYPSEVPLPYGNV